MRSQTVQCARGLGRKKLIHELGNSGGQTCLVLNPSYTTHLELLDLDAFYLQISRYKFHGVPPFGHYTADSDEILFRERSNSVSAQGQKLDLRKNTMRDWREI